MMKIFRISTLLMIVCILKLSIAGADEENILSIAIDENYPPYSLINIEGSPAGMWVDIWKLWSQKTGQKINFQPYIWQDTLTALKQGAVDIHFGLFRNKSRAQWINFSQPFYENGTALFYATKIDIPPTMKDLFGKLVGVVRGSYQENWLRENYANIKIVSKNNEESLIYALKDNRIYAFIGEEPTTNALLSKLGFRSDITKSGETLFRNMVFAGVLKNKIELLNLINSGFKKISRKELHTIEAHWIDNPADQYFHGPQVNLQLTQPEKIWLKEHKTIRVSGPKAFPPFHYFEEDGTLKGISWDFIQLIMGTLGVQMELLINLPWSEVLEKAQKHELDLISVAAKTAGREAYLEYTQPYLSFPLVIVSRKDAQFIGGLEDLHGKKVALVRKISTYDWLMRDRINIIPQFVDSPLNALKAVSFDQADASIGNLATVSYLIENNGLANLKVAAATTYGNYDLYFAVRKDWPEFVTILNKVLNTMELDHRQNIIRKWIKITTDDDAQQPIIFTEAEKAWLADHTTLRVANEDDWPPFDFSVAGKAHGISMDYINLIAAKIGFKLEFINGFTWAELQEKAKNKELEILTSIVKTPERQINFLFTDPYIESPSVILTLKDNYSIRKLKDLFGKPVAVIKGYYIEEYLRNTYPDIKSVHVDNILDGIKAVSYGKVDAFIGSLIVINYERNRALIPNLKIVGESGVEDIDATNLRFAVHKDSALLRDILQKGVEAVTPEEKLKIQTKWAIISKKQPTQATQPLIGLTTVERTWLRSHPKIRVHNETNWPPFDFFEDGQPKGLSIDYMNLLAEKIGIQITYITSPSWSELLNMAKNKKLDVMLNIVKTEDRQKFLLFTQPYALNPNVIASTKENKYEKRRLSEH